MTPEFDKYDIRAEYSTGGDNTEWQNLGDDLSDLETAPDNALRFRVFASYKNTDMMAVKEFTDIPDLEALDAQFKEIAPVINTFRVKGNPVILE